MSGALGVGDAWNLSHVGNGTGWLVYVRHFRSAPCCGALAVCLGMLCGRFQTLKPNKANTPKEKVDLFPHF